jgi:Arc/MetJ-type ribon-helix-helix transcriptional regulator
MATVRLDIKTETALKRLSVRRGQTRSEVIREAITRLAEEEAEPRSAYQRLEAFVGTVDSGREATLHGEGETSQRALERAVRGAPSWLMPAPSSLCWTGAMSIMARS